MMWEDKQIREVIEKGGAQLFLESIEIKRQVADNKWRWRNAEKQHTAYKEKLRSDLRAIQSECSHPSIMYYPDDSGGNNSAYECNVCGANVPRATKDSSSLEATE